ncbi:hypothetical protein [Bradyrhizobium neotropicale]|uniref:Glycosyltransferase RgtA/B/C/D-like domain-containing protein n=1 Tax=Bradyrhizobium neotropicale TaxID=1497615 RepID=A0A176YKG8_9BRAD|nr:hypothetical protein [Bradyrhizobium neotropicale]OAF06437.1 hypothetical protein AXW67_32225 [Bradyrhizobium neotropicale]
MLAWGALLVAIVVSFRPAVPVIWGDTPSFVESAFRTLEAGWPTVTGGRDPGYPALLAVTFASGGELGTVVRLQQAAWAILMLALAATAQAATRRAVGLVPIILVATYPGLLIFRNVLTADLLFAVFLNLTMAGLLVATCVGKTAQCCAVSAAVLCAALAASFRSQGILVPIVAVLVGASLARPDTSARLAVIVLSVAAALGLLVAGSRFGASNSDEASVVFVPKTLFCNHLNIVLASDAARREIVSAAGARADVSMARLAADFAAEPGRWPVLGFFGDACFFDTALDRDVAGDTGNAVGAAAAYRHIFLAAVRDRPLAYARKFVRQMAYGAAVAWPPYGLDSAIPVSTDDVPHVSDIMARHGRSVQPIDLQGGAVRIGLLSDLPGVSTYLYMALSTAFVIAVIFWTVTAVRLRRRGFLTRAGIVIVMWAASIATAAGAHTLDVGRYLIPSVPMVGVMLSLFAGELAERIACLRRG